MSPPPMVIEELDDDTWERMRRLNLDALIRMVRAAAPSFRASRGNVIAMSSVAAFGSDWNRAAHNAPKGAVDALVQSTALDLGATASE